MALIRLVDGSYLYTEGVSHFPRGTSSLLTDLSGFRCYSSSCHRQPLVRRRRLPSFGHRHLHYLRIRSPTFFAVAVNVSQMLTRKPSDHLPRPSLDVMQFDTFRFSFRAARGSDFRVRHLRNGVRLGYLYTLNVAVFRSTSSTWLCTFYSGLMLFRLWVTAFNV